MQMTNCLNINTIKNKLKELKSQIRGANKNESKLAMCILGFGLEIVSIL